MAEKFFQCPRAREVPIGHTDGTARWLKATKGTMRKYRACSFCGSAHPNDFMQACRDGVEIGPTDKSYKVYIGNHDGKFYFQHLSEEQRKEFFELYRDRKLNIGFPGDFYTLPFFIVRGGKS